MASLFGASSCCFSCEWAGVAVDSFHPLSSRFSYSINSVCAATCTTHHIFDLLSESLIHQSIHKWVNSGVQHDHNGRGISNNFQFFYWSIILQPVAECVSQPTNSEDYTDHDDHQGNSFSNLHHTLCIMTSDSMLVS